MGYTPPRLRDHTYIGQFRYFLTVCVTARARVFEDEAAARFVIEQFLLHAAAFKFEVLAYVVMPDHFHALVVGLADDSNLVEFMDRWKQKTGRWWKERGHQASLWQRGYHDRVMRENDVDESVIGYILRNPVRAHLVDDPRDYPYLGAARYDVQTLLESTVMWTPPWK